MGVTASLIKSNDTKSPFEKNLQDSIQQLRIMDQRRGIDSRTVFTDLYNAADYIHQGKQTWQNHLT